MRPHASTFALLFVACSVNPGLEDQPCPCASGFVCVADRCVEGTGGDAGEGLDAGEGTDAGPRRDAAGIDAAGLDAAGLDAGPPPSGAFVVDFAEGDHDGTLGTGGELALESGRTEGTYRSVVFDGDVAGLATLRWIPSAPYAKPLPRNGRAETGYAEGAIDMRENVVLYDFADATVSGGTMIMDLSGRDNQGEVIGSTPATPLAAPVGFGLSFVLDNYLVTALSQSDDLQMGSSDLTWMAWARSTQRSENVTSENRVFFGMEEGGSADPHIWFGLSHSCNGAAAGATMGGTFRSAAGNDADSYCGATVVNDGAWHLVAMTKTGHSSATMRVFVDGEADGAKSVSFNGPIIFSTSESMHYGSFRGGSFATIVDLAQVTISRRAFDSTEVRAAHRRAALRLEVRLRVCTESDCSDDPPFIGPMGASAYRDPVDNLSPPVTHPIDLSGDYVQMEVRLESDRPGESPRMTALSLNP